MVAITKKYIHTYIHTYTTPPMPQHKNCISTQVSLGMLLLYIHMYVYDVCMYLCMYMYVARWLLTIHMYVQVLALVSKALATPPPPPKKKKEKKRKKFLHRLI